MSPITRRAVAATELLLVCPAVLSLRYLSAVFVAEIRARPQCKSSRHVVRRTRAECRFMGTAGHAASGCALSRRRHPAPEMGHRC